MNKGLILIATVMILILIKPVFGDIADTTDIEDEIWVETGDIIIISGGGASNTEEMIVMILEDEEEKVYEVTYSRTLIEERVVNKSKKIFAIDDFEGFNVNRNNIGDGEWKRANYNEIYKDINMYVDGIEDKPDYYEDVFTHEYAHYLLYRLGLEDLEWHESIASAYNWYLNKETQKEIWGENNEERYYPYTIIMDKVIEEDNFDCLNEVFDYNVTLESIVSDLNEYCHVDLNEREYEEMIWIEVSY